MTLRRGLKTLRNRVLHGGVPAEARRFFAAGTPEVSAGRYLVNLSVDLELGFNGPFWRGEIDNSVFWGSAARRHLPRYLELVQQTKTPINVQLVGALLDPDRLSRDVFSSAQREHIERHPALFTLEPAEVEALAQPWIEPGIHAYSHRPFPDLTPGQAAWECSETIRLVSRRFGQVPTFMSFPKNLVAHPDQVAASGIERWRSQGRADDRAIDIGLWLAPGTITPGELGRLLRRLRQRTSGVLLHLWNHLQEMEASIFTRYVEAIEASEFELTLIRDLDRSERMSRPS